MLYLVATPIGNLKDFSFRAVEVLKSCDTILCEDTRHSRLLMTTYGISTRLESYHMFSEAKKLEKILADLQDGKEIALISDAGTPGISDPGSLLVSECVKRSLPITALPGPCAAIDALVLSGLDTTRFQFVGFVPRADGERRRFFADILSYPSTTVVYESPNRLIELFELLEKIAPKRNFVVARELTKMFEEVFGGSPAEQLAHWRAKPPKGEIVIVIEGCPEEGKDWEKMTPQEHVLWMEETYGLTHKEAVKIVASMRGAPKREIYNQTLS